MYWASLLIRSAAILAGAEMLRHWPRRSTPAYRHRIGLASLMLLLIWPLVSAFVPAIHIPLWISNAGSGTVGIEQPVRYFASEPVANSVNWPLIVWLAGVVIAFVPVLVGYVNVRQLQRRARPLDDPHWMALLDQACAQLSASARPKLLLVSTAITPLTFGVRNPRILLPSACLEWSASRRRAVLLHELAHVERRDVAAHLFAHAVCALWWFQPLSWMARWNLRRDSERACDATVLACGVRPSDYAAELLEVARLCTGTQKWSTGAIAMARPSQLEGRLRAILDPLPARGLRRSAVFSMSVLVLLTVSASAITLGSEKEVQSPGGSFMKHTVLAGLLGSAGLSAATIAGSVFDPSGAAVAGAKAQL